MLNRFNLSLDDTSPHAKCDLFGGPIKWCDKLIEKYPNIKINLFVSSAFCRLGEKPCYLSQHPEWVKKVNDLPGNYEINMHGLYHRRVDGKHENSNNDEFQYLWGVWAETITQAMIDEFDKAGLKYKKVFRPPGWRISIGAARVLTDKGFVIAGNDIYYQMLKDKVPKMKYVSYNWDITHECNISENIISCAHTSNWTNNYMNETRYNLIENILIKEEYEFVFIEDFIK